MRFLLLVLLFVTACAEETPMPRYTEFHFTEQQPYSIDVAKIEFVDNYAVSFDYPNVGHLSPIPLAATIRNWQQERLQSTGHTRNLRFVLQNASIVEEPLDSKNIVYRAVLNVMMEIYGGESGSDNTINDGTDIETADMKVDITHSVVVPKSATLEEKSNAIYALVRDTIRQFDQKVAENIIQYLGKFVYTD
jgi:hypothetical protein